jgi:hypothetical protein
MRRITWQIQLYMRCYPLYIRDKSQLQVIMIYFTVYPSLFIFVRRSPFMVH